MNILKHLLNLQIIPYIGLFIIKIISSTYKIRIINPDIERNILKRGHVPIYASWHQRFFPGITFLASRKPVSIMISQSRDGELISKIVSFLGIYPVRGSSSKGGRQALKEIKKLIHEGYKAAHIVDGPTGPLGVVKPGLLIIAQTSGMPIVPIITSAEKKWVFNSWDSFMVPKPFSRIIMKFVDEIYIHRKMKETDFEKKRMFIEDILKKSYVETDAMWSNQEEVDRLFNT